MGGKRRKQQQLTNRQIEVLVLAARGNSYKAMAHKLGVAEVTIGYHLARLHAIFRTDNIVGLATTAIVYGILSAGILPIEATGQTLLDLGPTE